MTSRATFIAALAASALAIALPAVADPVAFPGGAIDGDRLAEGEIYLAAPQAAPVLAGCEAAQAYVEAINAGDFDRVTALFAEDAIVFHAAGPAVGRQAVHDFYSGRIGRLGVVTVPVAYAVGPRSCLVQLAVGRLSEGESAQYYSASFDQFLFDDDGQVRMMIVYGRRSPVAEGTVRAIRAAPAVK